MTAHRYTKSALFVVAFFAFISAPAMAATLDFDVPVPGTILDANGVGTGFNTRLPGTGASFVSNDPNLELLTAPGRLLLTSTNADIHLSRALNNLEAPGFLLKGIGSGDVTIRAKIDGVNLPNPSDQIMLYAGTSATQVLRGGFHDGNFIPLIANNGGTDQILTNTPAQAFVSFDDLILNLTRASGLWSISWQNLSHPGMSGSSAGVSLPWLDAANDLYFGVMAANANSNTPFTTAIDWIDVSGRPTPEPSTAVLCFMGAGLLIWSGRPAWRRRT